MECIVEAPGANCLMGGIKCSVGGSDAYACTGTAAACPTNGSQQLWLKLNSSPITALLYQDSRPTVLLPGVTVSYVVYANASGQTAGPSNEFTLPLPLAPVAPSSLAATATAQ